MTALTNALSQEAKIGIGVGATIGGLLLVILSALAIISIMRRRRTKNRRRTIHQQHFESAAKRATIMMDMEQQQAKNELQVDPGPPIHDDKPSERSESPGSDTNPLRPIGEMPDDNKDGSGWMAW